MYFLIMLVFTHRKYKKHLSLCEFTLKILQHINYLYLYMFGIEQSRILKETGAEDETNGRLIGGQHPKSL